MYVLSILKVLHVLLLFSFLRTRATFLIISNRNFSQIRQPHAMHQKHMSKAEFVQCVKAAWALHFSVLSIFCIYLQTSACMFLARCSAWFESYLDL